MADLSLENLTLKKSQYYEFIPQEILKMDLGSFSTYSAAGTGRPIFFLYRNAVCGPHLLPSGDSLDRDSLQV